MSAADGIRLEIDQTMDAIAETVNLLSAAEKHIEEISGSVMLIGLSSQHESMMGSLHIAQLLKVQNDISLKYLFELRERLRVYRDKP